MSAPALHSIQIIQPGSGPRIATVRVSPPRGEPGPAGADGAPRTWESLEGKPATFPPASHTHTTSDITGLTESMATKADLVGGVIPTAQIPAVAITSYLGSVASQAAMLALSGQTGDWCNRSDTSTAWVLTSSPPDQISSWAQINYPASPVTSVNGQSGVIVLSAANVGAPPATRQVATRWSLEGGGTLAADRTLQLAGDSLSPGPNKRYGTNSTGARGWFGAPFTETGTLQGHTDAGSSEIPPGSASIEIYFQEDVSSGIVRFALGEMTDFGFSMGDEMEYPTIVNSSGGTPVPADLVAANFASFVNSNYGSHITASYSGSTSVLISTVDTGSYATLRIYTEGMLGSLGVSPYNVVATGTDAIPASAPSGGIFGHYLTGTRLQRLMVSVDGWLPSGTISLIRHSDGALMARLSSLYNGIYDVLPEDEAQMLVWIQGGACRLELEPTDRIGGSVRFAAYFLD